MRNVASSSCWPRPLRWFHTLVIVGRLVSVTDVQGPSREALCEPTEELTEEGSTRWP